MKNFEVKNLLNSNLEKVSKKNIEINGKVSTKQEAEAYFAGRKQLSLLQFHNMFVVREIKSAESKNLLLG